MRKFRNIAVTAAAAALVSAAVLSGCSSGSDTAETTTAAESETETESTEAETLSEDAQAIADLDPVKPDDMGTVKLGDIASLKFNAPEPEVIDEDSVNELISYYLSLGGESAEVDGAAEDGQTVNIDFVGKIDGEEFDGGSSEGYDLVLGSGTFIEGFEDGLLGCKAGDTKTLELTFPEDYTNDELAGKPVTFEVKVNSVTRALTYEDLTDEIASEYSGGEYATADEYRAAIREYLEKSALAVAKNEVCINAVNALVESSEVEASDAAVEWAIDVYIQSSDQLFKTYSQSYGLTGMNGLAEYLESSGQSYADYRESLKEDARALAEQTAVVDAVAKEQGYEYNDDALKEYLTDFGYEEQEDTIKENNTESALSQTVIQYLVGKYIADNADVTYLSYEDYEALTDSTLEDAAAEAEAADAADADDVSEADAADIEAAAEAAESETAE